MTSRNLNSRYTSGRGGQFRGSRGMEGRSRWQGRGRGTTDERGVQKNRNRERPTHFLCIPLHNHPDLRKRITAFQSALFDGYDVGQESMIALPQASSRPTQIRNSSLVEGLDSTIVIDPVRMHMTLGVMALDENAAIPTPQGTSFDHSSLVVQRKTISTALNLLMSLLPEISQILKGSKVLKVPLEVLDVLKTEKIRPKGQDANNSETQKKGKKPNYCDRIGAGVLFVAPREVPKALMDGEKQKLMEICKLVNRTFKDHGYLMDHRPLKLHCTILNASHRKPTRWCPFSYTDILESQACNILAKQDMEGIYFGGRNSSEAGGLNHAVESSSSFVPSPLPIDLGTWDVREIQLWKMGSRDSEGKYVSCGGIRLGE